MDKQMQPTNISKQTNTQTKLKKTKTFTTKR